MNHQNAKNVDKAYFQNILKVLYENGKCFTRTHAVTAFEKTGLFPFNKFNIDLSKLKITETFEDPAQELASQSALPISLTAQRSSISLTPMSNTSVELYNKTHISN